MNESYSDQGEGESPVKGGRMTRLRARGGIRDRPPIIDDDDDEIFRAAPPPTQTVRKRKAGAGRKPVAEKVVERIGAFFFGLFLSLNFSTNLIKVPKQESPNKCNENFRKANCGKTASRPYPRQ